MPVRSGCPFPVQKTRCGPWSASLAGLLSLAALLLHKKVHWGWRKGPAERADGCKKAPLSVPSVPVSARERPPPVAADAGSVSGFFVAGSVFISLKCLLRHVFTEKNAIFVTGRIPPAASAPTADASVPISDSRIRRKGGGMYGFGRDASCPQSGFFRFRMPDLRESDTAFGRIKLRLQDDSYQ